MESRIKEHLMLAVSANNWGTNELPLSPRSYHNSVMDQQRSHKNMVEKVKASPSKIKRQLNVRARYYSKVLTAILEHFTVYYNVVTLCVCTDGFANGSEDISN